MSASARRDESWRAGELQRAKGERTGRPVGSVMEARVITVAAQLNLVDVACRKRDGTGGFLSDLVEWVGCSEIY